ncbi:MAG: ABC transporter permease subunit [Anaerolineae bacterium]|jgi:ABC-2 type transport system permease protein
MGTIFRYRLRRFRGQIVGWGIGLALLALLLVQFYDTVVEQEEQLSQMLDSYPQEFMAFFGGVEDFASPSGYLNVEFFSYMPIILGIFAVLMGSGLLASDEEAGRLDLLLAYPVNRAPFFVGRVLAFVVAMLGILFIVWLSLAVPSRWTLLKEVSVVEMALPCLSVFGTMMFFGMLALLFSMVLPSRRAAAMLSGLVLVASFFLPGLALINDAIAPLARWSPLQYYQGGEAIDGLNVTWLAGLLGLAVLWAASAWWRFERRDIRVGGEGGWQRPALAQLLPRVLGIGD